MNSRFVDKLINTHDLTELLDQVMAELQDICHCDGIIITLYQQQDLFSKGLLLPTRFKHLEETYRDIKFPLVLHPDNSADVYFIDRQNLAAVDVYIKDRFEKWEMSSLWVFPITQDDKVLGNAFIFHCDTIAPLNTFNITLSKIEDRLHCASNLIGKYNQLECLQQQKTEIEKQHENNDYFFSAISTINSISNSEEMYKTILKEFLKITNFDFSLIYLQNGEHLIPEAVYYTNPKFKPISERFLHYLKENPYSLNPEDGSVPTAFLHNEHFFFPDIYKIIHVQMPEKSRRALELMGTPRSAFHTPVLYQGKPIGVLTLGSVEQTVDLTEEDIEKITLMSSFVGSAIKNAELYTEVESLNKTLETRVAEQTEEIQLRLQKYSALADFLSNMSHELRTPMNAILGFAQLLSYERNLTDTQQQNVQEIRRASQHLLDLINDVLDLSRIESGRMTLSLEPVLPLRVINDCFRLMEPLARAHEVTLEANFNTEESTFIQADCIRLRQALLNLFSNAIKYNKVNGKVRVHLTRLHADNTLEIAVEDTGIGIPVLRQPEVFQAFNRLGAETGSIEGNGVGLLITKRLVELMRGEIGFVSHQGQGSRFYIRLPVLLGHTETAPADGVDIEAFDSKSQLLIEKPKSILYVEDNQSNIRVMQQFFAHYDNLSLDVAEEAVMGLYKARMNNPDLIILDINLPGMDGYEALAVLKKDPITCNTPIIALSANAMAYDIERGKTAGFDYYLTKPLDFNVFIQTLNLLLTN